MHTRHEQVIHQLVPRDHVHIRAVSLQNRGPGLGLAHAGIPHTDAVVSGAARKHRRLRWTPLQVLYAALSLREHACQIRCVVSATSGSRTLWYVAASPTAQRPPSAGSHRCNYDMAALTSVTINLTAHVPRHGSVTLTGRTHSPRAVAARQATSSNWGPVECKPLH